MSAIAETRGVLRVTPRPLTPRAVKRLALEGFPVLFNLSEVDLASVHPEGRVASFDLHHQPIDDVFAGEDPDDAAQFKAFADLGSRRAFIRVVRQLEARLRGGYPTALCCDRADTLAAAVALAVVRRTFGLDEDEAVEVVRGLRPTSTLGPRARTAAAWAVRRP